METLNYDEKCWKAVECPKFDCRKKNCCCGLKYIYIPAALTSTVTPEKGRYSNAIVEYEETGAIWIFSEEGIPVNIKEGNAS